MRDLVLRALDTARSQGASYADARVVARKSESITVRNQNVEALTADESLGFGVRVIVDGYWGFASSQRMTLEEADRVAAQAVRIARASARAGGPQANIGPPEVHQDRYRTPIQERPLRGVARRQDRAAPPGERGDEPSAGHRDGGVERLLPAGGEDLRQQRGQPHRAGAGRDGLRHRGDGGRRGRGAAPLLPQQRRPPPGHGGLGVRRALRPARETPAASPRRRRRSSRRSPAPPA